MTSLNILIRLHNGFGYQRCFKYTWSKYKYEYKYTRCEYEYTGHEYRYEYEYQVTNTFCPL